MTNPVTPRLGPWLVRNPLDQAASVILIQATPRWFSGHMAHLAPTSASTTLMTPTAPLLSSNGPLPGMVFWSSNVRFPHRPYPKPG